MLESLGVYSLWKGELRKCESFLLFWTICQLSFSHFSLLTILFSSVHLWMCINPLVHFSVIYFHFSLQYFLTFLIFHWLGQYFSSILSKLPSKQVYLVTSGLFSISVLQTSVKFGTDDLINVKNLRHYRTQM